MFFDWVRAGLGLAALCIAVAGCGDDTQTAIEPIDHVEASGSGQTPVTTVPFGEASTLEQEAFDQMHKEAMADGAMSASELEVFVLETVQCTKRAGFESTLVEFDPQTGDVTFSVAADGPDDETGNVAAESCANTFYIPAHGLFLQSNGPSEQEALLQQEQREIGYLSCLKEAGFEFEDAQVALASEQVPNAVYESCLPALFK